MKIVPFMIQTLLVLILSTTNYGECRPQSDLANMSTQAQVHPLDQNNNRNISGISRRGWRGEWRRTDPGTVYSYIWKSSDEPLGKAELYIILALLIGMATVIVGCWLSDNCWSPEPEQPFTIAWHDRHRWI